MDDMIEWAAQLYREAFEPIEGSERDSKNFSVQKQLSDLGHPEPVAEPGEVVSHVTYWPR